MEEKDYKNKDNDNDDDNNDDDNGKFLFVNSYLSGGFLTNLVSF